MKKILFTILTSCLYTVLAIQPSQASDKTWICNDDSWGNPVCWDSAGQPRDGDDVYLINSDLVEIIVSYSKSIVPELELNSLTVDNTGGGSVTLFQAQDTLVSSEEYIGYDGSGFFSQTGGENIVGDLYLGYQEASDGTYSLSDTGELRANNEIISRLGTGTFIQTGGTNEANYIAISKCDETECGSGAYNLSDGSLSVTNMDVASSGNLGYGGVGVFNQSGGSVIVSDRLNLADYRGASGTYELSAGSLEAGELGVWDVDQTGITGVFNQTGGIVVTDRVVSTYASFTYNLEDGSLIADVIDLQVFGTINQTGGSIDVSTIKLDSDSTFNFNGGTLKVDNFTGNLVNNGGTLSPGDSLGTTNINGNYTQTADGTFKVEIGGHTQGEEYDWLNITGSATLEGALDVSFLASDSGLITLGEGDVFDILFAESITGEFDQLVLTALDGGLKWGVSYITEIEDVPDFVRLTINANQLPTADAGFNQVVDEGMIVVLDGSVSSDSDGTVDGYSWRQTAGTEVNLSDADTVTPSFVAPVVFADTVLAFSLLVTDDSGETDEVTVAVTVTDVLVVDAGADQQATEGGIVQLNGLSSLSVSNNVASYLWEQIDEGPKISLDGSDSATPSFIVHDVDVTQLFVFRLTVTDSNGLQDSDTTFVNVRDKSFTNIVPVPPLAVQLLELEVKSGDFNQFTVFDPFGTSDIQWSQISGPTVTLSDSNTTTPSFIAPEVTTDSAATFEVRLTDTDGLVVRSFVSANILESTSFNRAPTANAGIEQVVTEGATVNLDATASISNDDENIRYYWQQTGGPIVLLSSIIEPKPTFVAPVVSDTDGDIILTFELTVTDESGLVDRQSVSITILDNGITSFADEVTAIFSSTGKQIGIEVIGGGSLVSLEVIVPNTVVDKTNLPELLPYGLIDFSLRVEPGSTIEVNFVLPEKASENVTWWKYVDGSGWIDFSDYTRLNAAGNVLTITLTDNDTYDDDPTPGVIRDPGGLGLKQISAPIPVPTSDPTPAPPIEEASDSGGVNVGGSFSPLLIVLLFLINYFRLIAKPRATNRPSNRRY